MRRTPQDETNFYEQKLIGDNTDDGVDVDAREETVGKLRVKIAAGAFIIAAGTAATTYFLTR
ncbi:MAG TPA: hypothetical protein VJK30_03185 [Coxiellaceae bacterium]|nr:MAG: hypothetical protein A3E81_03575 [Gammaproteobacteria bacterium RIFCSPHIGHO2_12_FULL_36_30]HLB56318.1 hypothetical protein [Coxiellaceae bacterium]